jgi:hypothetical protein
MAQSAVRSLRYIRQIPAVKLLVAAHSYVSHHDAGPQFVMSSRCAGASTPRPAIDLTSLQFEEDFIILRIW